MSFIFQCLFIIIVLFSNSRVFFSVQRNLIRSILSLWFQKGNSVVPVARRTEDTSSDFSTCDSGDLELRRVLRLPRSNGGSGCAVPESVARSGGGAPGDDVTLVADVGANTVHRFVGDRYAGESSFLQLTLNLDNS